MKAILVVGLCVCVISQVAGHGRLVWPPGRPSIRCHAQFQSVYTQPWNYNDNEANCGGRDVQHEQNGGKCGECGDNVKLARPRPNEGGGTYDRQIIVDRYAVGQVMDIQVQLTANHLGYFEFRLCPQNKPGVPEEQSCLDLNLLKVLESNGQALTGTQVPVPAGVSDFYIKAKLPAGLRCNHCVLQWHYRVGNSYGQCEDGTIGPGCGGQETFRACADIAVNSTSVSPSPVPVTHRCTVPK